MALSGKFCPRRRGRLAAFPCLLFILACMVACNGDTQTIPPTPTPLTSLQFTPLDLGLPAQALAAPIIGTVPDSTILHVAITFKINADQLNQLGINPQAQATATAGSDTIATRLGIDDVTYQRIKAFFGIENAAVKLSKTRTNLTVAAKAGSFARLFQTRFVLHTLNGRTFYTPDPAKPPRIPTLLASSILAVTGLDNYSLPPQQGFFPVKQTQSQQTKVAKSPNCAAEPGTVLPQSIAQAYGFSAFWKEHWHGENMAVNLVEIDGFNASDISTYFSCVAFKGKLDTVTVDGNAPAAGGESTLDLDMLAGLAPGLHLIDYQTDISHDQNYNDVWVQVNDALQQIISDHTNMADSAEVVSMSLGLSEEYMTRNDLQAIDQSLQILNKGLHMTIFVASGDCAAFTDRTFNHLSVSFPASDPYVVAVGGTVMSVNRNGSRGNEIAWSDGADATKCQNQWGSGGGLSKIFTRPDWQLGVGVSNRFSDGKRQLPDVSAIAENLPVYFQSQWIVVGGTSAAAPIWAAGMSLLNQGLLVKQGGYFYGPDIFYNVANSRGRFHPFYDVTQGNNLYYHAASGWDYATGLGTPNLADLFSVLYQNLH